MLISSGFPAPKPGSKTWASDFEPISQSHLVGTIACSSHRYHRSMSPEIPPSAEALIEGLMKAVLDEFHLRPIQLPVAGILFLQAAQETAQNLRMFFFLRWWVAPLFMPNTNTMNTRIEVNFVFNIWEKNVFVTCKLIIIDLHFQCQPQHKIQHPPRRP